MNYLDIFDNHILKIKSENRYRNFQEIVRYSEDFPYAYHKKLNKKIVLWCINDYLGMSANKKVIDSAIRYSQDQGVGSGGTRNIGGSNSEVIKLEQLIGKLHNKDNALLFTSGYVANDATISVLPKIIPNLVYLSDEKNHASIIRGISNSKAKKEIFAHNSVKDLEEKIKKIGTHIPKMIIFESVYSMDGSISPINEIIEIAKKYNALTYIDEVHSVGIYGNNGAGIARKLGLDNQIDIIQGTLSKAFGVTGGYIASKNNIIDAIRLSSPGFIFTTSLPPMIASSARSSILHLMESNKEREDLMRNVKLLKNALNEENIKFKDGGSHIIPIHIGCPIISEKITEILLVKYGIYVQHINYPTVSKGQERLRIVPNSGHTYEMIYHLVKSLSKTLKEFGIIKNSKAA